MNISIIAALANNRVIGCENKLPWHLRADLQHFKQCTWGKPIVMGRKTFLSIGKALPGRTNIILSRQDDFAVPDFQVFSHPKQLQTLLASEIMIIGGAEIYRSLLPLATTLYLTLVDCEPHGDAFFPKWDPKAWTCIEEQQGHKDAQNDHDYRFLTLTREHHADWETL